MRVKRIRHSGIVVENLEQSLSFYQDLLGFKVASRMQESGVFIDRILGLPGTEVVTVKLQCGDGQMIELLDYRTNRGERPERRINQVGITHVAFEVEDLATLYQDLLGAGIDFISSPQIAENNFAKVAFCRAPEGTYIELVEVLAGKNAAGREPGLAMHGVRDE